MISNRNVLPAGKDIYVLGIRDGHYAGAALIKNGVVIAAISEERLTNIKSFSGIPTLSLGKVFDIARVDPSVVTQIAIASYVDITPIPEKVDQNPAYRLSEYVAPYFHGPVFNKWAVKVMRMMSPRTTLFQVLDTLGIRQKPVVFIEHHLAHAACAFYQKTG